MNNLVKINNNDLQVKEFNNKRVVTLKDIDTLHQRPEGTSRRNFNQNKKHFIADKDYFVRNMHEAKEEFGVIAPNGLILLTESGYLMIVKSLQDDLAWKVQRELIDNYFKVKNNMNMPLDLGFADQMLNLAQGTQILGQVVQGMMTTIGGMKEYVQDSIQVKDKQIDDIAAMVGLRTKNTRALTEKLKSTLKETYHMYAIDSTMEIYKKAKSKIFKEFKVYKWEEISVIQYNAVEAFIENMFD